MTERTLMTSPFSTFVATNNNSTTIPSSNTISQPSSSSSSSHLLVEPIASERWNVQRNKAVLDTELGFFYEQHTAVVNGLRNAANFHAVDLVNKIFLKMRWSHPEWPMSIQRVVVEYCHLILNQMPQSKILPTQQLFEVWLRKADGRGFHRLAGEIQAMIEDLRQTFVRRDVALKVGERKLGREIELLVTKHEGRLRWQMERNRGEKDAYWTIWYLAAKGQLVDLERFILQGKNRQEKIDAAAAAAEALAMAKSDMNEMMTLGHGVEERKETMASTNTEEEEEDEDAKADRLMSYRLSLRLRMKYRAVRAFDMDERDPDFGRTALHYACRRGKHEVVRLLLDHGCDLSLKEPDGRSPLHFAAAYGSREMVLELLGRGAKVEDRDNYGCTALDLAEQSKNFATYRTLHNWTHWAEDLSGTHLVGGDTTLGDGGVSATPGTTWPLDQEGVLVVASSSSMAQGENNQWGMSTIPQQQERGTTSAGVFVSSSVLGEVQCVWGDPTEPPVDTDAPDMSYPLKMLLRRYLVREREVVPWVGVGPGGVELEEMVPVDASSYLTDMRLCEKVSSVCFAEGYLALGLRAMRRRWALAFLLGARATTQSYEEYWREEQEREKDRQTQLREEEEEEQRVREEEEERGREMMQEGEGMGGQGGKDGDRGRLSRSQSQLSQSSTSQSQAKSVSSKQKRKGKGNGKGVTWHNNDDNVNHDNADAADDAENEDEDDDEDGTMSAYDQDLGSSKHNGSDKDNDPTDPAESAPSALALVSPSTAPPQRWLTSILREPPPAPPPDPYDETIRDQEWQKTKPHQRVDYRFGYELLAHHPSTNATAIARANVTPSGTLEVPPSPFPVKSPARPSSPSSRSPRKYNSSSKSPPRSPNKPSNHGSSNKSSTKSTSNRSPPRSPDRPSNHRASDKSPPQSPPKSPPRSPPKSPPKSLSRSSPPRSVPHTPSKTNNAGNNNKITVPASPSATAAGASGMKMKRSGDLKDSAGKTTINSNSSKSINNTNKGINNINNTVNNVNNSTGGMGSVKKGGKSVRIAIATSPDDKNKQTNRISSSDKDKDQHKDQGYANQGGEMVKYQSPTKEIDKPFPFPFGEVTFHAVALTSMMGDDRIRYGPRDTPRSRTPSPTKRPPKDILTVQQDAVATALRRRMARLKALDDNQNSKKALAITRGGTGSSGGNAGLLLDGGDGGGSATTEVVLAIEDGNAGATIGQDNHKNITTTTTNNNNNNNITNNRSNDKLSVPPTPSSSETKDSSGPGPSAPVRDRLRRRTKPKTHPLPPLAAASIGLDLAERYLQLQYEGYANELLSQSCALLDALFGGCEYPVAEAVRQGLKPTKKHATSSVAGSVGGSAAGTGTVTPTTAATPSAPLASSLSPTRPLSSLLPTSSPVRLLSPGDPSIPPSTDPWPLHPTPSDLSHSLHEEQGYLLRKTRAQTGLFAPAHFDSTVTRASARAGGSPLSGTFNAADQQVSLSGEALAAIKGFEVQPMSLPLSLGGVDAMSGDAAVDSAPAADGGGGSYADTTTFASGVGGIGGGVVGASSVVLFGSAGAGKLRDDERQGLGSRGGSPLGVPRGGSRGGGSRVLSRGGGGESQGLYSHSEELLVPSITANPDISLNLEASHSLDASFVPGVSLDPSASPGPPSALSGFEAQCAYGNVMDLVAHLAHQGRKVGRRAAEEEKERQRLHNLWLVEQAKLARLAGRPPDVDVLVGLVRAEAGLAHLPAQPLDGSLHLDEDTGTCAQMIREMNEEGPLAAAASSTYRAFQLAHTQSSSHRNLFHVQNNTGSNDSNNHKSLNKVVNFGNPSPDPNTVPTLAGSVGGSVGGGGSVGASTEQVVAPGTLALLLGVLVRRCEVMLLLHDLLFADFEGKAPPSSGATPTGPSLAARVSTDVPRDLSPQGAGLGPVGKEKTKGMDKDKSHDKDKKQFMKDAQIHNLHHHNTHSDNHNLHSGHHDHSQGSFHSHNRVDDVFAVNVRRRETLLMHCKLCATRAVATHFLLHCHDVTEPHTLCPILTLLASVYERQGRIYEAADVVEYAVAVASRELGPDHRDSLRLALTQLRLDVKGCVSKQAFHKVYQEGVIINRRLQVLRTTDPWSAQMFTRECVELTSMCRLFEEVQDDLERLKIKEIVQGNEREARRDARAVENAKMAEMRAKFKAPGSLSAMFSTSPHIINTAPRLNPNQLWPTEHIHPHAIVGERDLPVMLAVETLQGQGLGPGLGLTKIKGGTQCGSNNSSSNQDVYLDNGNDNHNHLTEGAAYSTLSQWPADLRGLQAMGLGQGQGLGQEGGGGGDLLGPLHTAFPMIADLVRRHGSRPGSRQRLDQGQGLGQGQGTGFSNTVTVSNHSSHPPGLSGSNSRQGSSQGTAFGHSHSRPVSRQEVAHGNAPGPGLGSLTPGSTRPGTGADTQPMISSFNTSRPSSRPAPGPGLGSPSSRPSTRPVSRLMAVAHLVDRVTASGTAPSLQAVSTFSDSEQAMSIAPIFLPPLAPGRYLPPSGYAPDELALARQLSLQGIVAPDKGLGLGRGSHQKQGLEENDNQPMRHRDKVHGLRRELQARRQEMVVDKVKRLRQDYLRTKEATARYRTTHNNNDDDIDVL